ncbi:neuronal regeneration-related protein isoform X1 [Arvicanthis niloticus]|uniref:neuronal regeneration-related protein isoform X1 n=1 Tax=Arvicanthis niloticus TaxID=61156 RepID=UPI00403D1872
MPRPQVYYYSRAAQPLLGGPPPRLARPQTAASASLFVCKAAARRGGEPARVRAALPGLLRAVPFPPHPPRAPCPTAATARVRGPWSALVLAARPRGREPLIPAECREQRE